MQARDDSSADLPRSKGVYVTEGAEFTIHGFQITLGADGPEASISSVSLRQDLCRHWLRIAVEHVKDAVAANNDLRDAEARGQDTELSLPLELEFRASMQAIVSAAIAFDAFYAAVKDRISIQKTQTDEWRKNKTARWRQMAEVFRVGFVLDHDRATKTRESLRVLSMYRDWAVHPPVDKKEPILHPDIHRSVEWRFVAFRRKNAVALTQGAISIIHTLSSKPNAASELGKYCGPLHRAIDDIAQTWIREFPGHPVTPAQREASAGES
jgi:hypothetical protein